MSTQPRTGAERPPKRVDALDAIRGLAALAIVFFHLEGVGDVAVPGALSAIPTHFALGVQIFFVLSAFSLFWKKA